MRPLRHCEHEVGGPVNGWTLIFVLTTAFQIYRGTLSDVLIFGLITTLLFIQRVKRIEKFTLPFRFALTPRTIFFVVASGLFLYVTPRHSAYMAFWFLASAPLIAAVAISHDEPQNAPDHKSAQRAEFLWSAWAIVMALAELMAYICSRVFSNEKAYPTISVLIQPEFNGGAMKALFIALWLPTGIWLLSQGVKK
jgi:hypothetical protein